MSIQNGKSLEEFKYIGDMNVIGISKKKSSVSQYAE